MMLIDNCQQQCVCHAGQGVVCQAHSCKPGQVCEPSGGVLSCITKGAGLRRALGGWEWRTGTPEQGVVETLIFTVGGTEDQGSRSPPGDLWAGISRAWNRGAPRMEGRDSYGRIQAVWIYSPGLCFLGQVSETLCIRQGQANFFPKGPDDKYFNLQGLRASVIATQLCHHGVKSAIDYVSEEVRIS